MLNIKSKIIILIIIFLTLNCLKAKRSLFDVNSTIGLTSALFFGNKLTSSSTTSSSTSSSTSTSSTSTSSSAYTIGGTITGLIKSGLVLQNNAGDDLTIASGQALLVLVPRFQVHIL
jgi:hypothetical protein